jgi:hypothetical protein
MKAYTHAWIAFKAIERLERTIPPADRNWKYADGLINWFKCHKDGVIDGAWYPDWIIKDTGNGHGLKFTPGASEGGMFGTLPAVMQIYKMRRKSTVFGKAYSMDPHDNLPQRCEALAHSVIDNLKIQRTENRGSPVSPTDNHIALILFMLSHYVADAHMPLHCDHRPFSDGKDIHGAIEELWELEVEKYFEIDVLNHRFFYNPRSYPLLKIGCDYSTSLLNAVECDLTKRPFVIDYGKGNNNVLDYMRVICQYSYLLSHSFVPLPNDNSITLAKLKAQNQPVCFEEMSRIVLADAIDSVARVWLRVWRRYAQWKEELQQETGKVTPTVPIT